MSTSVLFVGAHCGDAEITGGAALAQAVRLGGSAAVLHLTAGEKGHPTLTPAQYGRIKRDEAQAAAEVLGLAHMRILDHSDAELLPSEELAAEIAGFVRAVRPSVVITHWAHSIHPDHEAAHVATTRAIFLAAIKWLVQDEPAHSVQRVLFAENWEDRRGFEPQVYLDAAADWDTWRRAVECYSLFRGEVVRFPYVRYYDALSVVRGAESGFERAIAFTAPADAHRLVLREL